MDRFKKDKDIIIRKFTGVRSHPFGMWYAVQNYDIYNKKGVVLKKQKVLTSVLTFILLSIQIYSQTDSSKKSDQEELKIILKKCAQYCEKLSNIILDFVCLEIINETVNPQRTTNTYTYDYQMIRKDNQIRDRRILLEENGKKRHEEDALLKTKRYKHHNIIFGPIGLLAELWQSQYDYKIIQRKRFKGDKVVIIEATPNDKMAASHPYGKVWVREGDFCIVKIEWDQRSLGNLDVLEYDAKRFNSTPEVKIYAEYAFEKNGIRFPSKYNIVETYYQERVRYITRSRIYTTYKDYKFFTVESAVKYKLPPVSVSEAGIDDIAEDGSKTVAQSDLRQILVSKFWVEVPLSAAPRVSSLQEYSSGQRPPFCRFLRSHRSQQRLLQEAVFLESLWPLFQGLWG